MARSFAQRLLAPLARRAEKRLPSLTRLRSTEPLPICLHRRRIYILPTAFGVVFALILFVMLLGALNYNNNTALLLTCVLGATCITSMLQTFRNLDRLELHSIRPDNAHAGQPLTLHLVWHAGGHPHQAVAVLVNGHEQHFDACADPDGTETLLKIPTQRRGWMPLPRVQVATRWPFGWFRAWSWLAPAQQALVYPRIEPGGPAPPPESGQVSRQRRPQGDEWAGLRDYRSGDPLRRIAWKASAHGDTLRVKTFDRPRADRAWQLDWNHTGLADREARISRLARWVREAHGAGREWSLALPHETLPPASGSAHYHHSMRALAELS